MAARAARAAARRARVCAPPADGHATSRCTAWRSAPRSGRHHGGEDAVAFPELADQFPELRPVLEELGRDHRLVGELLGRLEELLGGGLDQERAADARTELDSLAALLESHFTYEERRLVAALNSLRRPDWDASPPGFLLSSPAQIPR